MVFVDGVRTPFLASLTDFQHLSGCDLMVASLGALLERTGLPAGEVDYVVVGNALQDARYRACSAPPLIEQVRLHKRVADGVRCTTIQYSVLRTMGKRLNGNFR